MRQKKYLIPQGKSILFKNFANIDSIPICLDTQDTEEIIRTCKLISPTLGGINLEDISAPRCIEIERRLIEELDIPVMHDDQHGTAIVVTAALINACKLANKNITDLSIAMSGTGAAGSAIATSLKNLGVKHIYAYNIKGALSYQKYDNYDSLEKELLDEINQLGVGPMGFGGTTTALAVKINAFPCHIASLPVAINLQCHASRHKEVTI